MSRTEFGARLKAARKHAKLNQKQLAAGTGLSQSTLSELETSGYESGKTAQIARLCGVDAYWLATGEGTMLAAPAPASQAPTGSTYSLPTPTQPLTAHDSSRAALVYGLSEVTRAVAAMTPGRWGMVRAALDQLPGHPEMVDDVIADVMPLLDAPTKRPATA